MDLGVYIWTSFLRVFILTGLNWFMNERNYIHMTVFSCVGIDGLADQEKQKRINGILQEPIKTCIMNEGWKSDIEKQQLLNNVKIYIAYQSEEWLSVVYSVLKQGFHTGVLTV